MLTVFIVKTNSKTANVQRAVDSFCSGKIWITEFVYIDNINIINTWDMKSRWYVVLYDNEFLDISLVEALPQFLLYSIFDMLCFFRRANSNKFEDVNLEYTTRMFKNNIKIDKNLNPINGKDLQHEKILNGWLYYETQC